MSNLPLAFLLGLMGSLHCAVMCGPLMLSLPMSQKNQLWYAIQLLLYQLGRVLVYAFLGLLVGIIGSSITLFTNQETLSLLVGILLIIFSLIYFSGRYFKYLNRFQTILVSPISKLMGRIYGLPFWGFFAGMLNGLIPCGMVYLALATALNAHSIKESISFMFLFGLGTTPLMLLISLGGIYLKKHIRFNPNKLIPWFMLFLGALFILRSSELGVPFLSPAHNINVHNHAAECR
ncbi:sulfite exporter TauE/SafE family protein [Pedobacter boryungensis]|uniref:Sulfite exporter TauE/SafE family protein n=1 Tax=Pedobacter boryungensis TaxID=869962 RepID=A0ABX2DEN4_9SPHI|nr:sulfite exporter TauE/SafE family protein [Pedobacter boryungensis]NQX31594.1 sulfite exporter TauE/SafE family protein [Pedobacter boryungensis]